MFTGFGKFFDSDRRLIYEGEYLKNLYHGEGVQYRLDGTVRYKGFWEHGKKHGSGKYIRKDGSVQYYGTAWMTIHIIRPRLHRLFIVFLFLLYKSS